MLFGLILAEIRANGCFAGATRSGILMNAASGQLKPDF
jgi:hypothetical protein